MVDWPLTFKCNNNCMSCIYNMDMVETLKIGNPSEKSIKKAIDSVGPGDTLGMTGGEPTIRKDFLKFLEYARSRDPRMNVFLVSNGRMFSYMDFVKKTASVGLENLKIGIAIYGHSPEIHDAVTRVPGSFKQTIKGIKNLIDSGIPVELRVIVNRLNYSSLERMAGYMARNFKGIYRVVFINMKYTGNAYINRKSLFVRYRDVVPHAEKAADILTKNGIDVKLFHFPLCVTGEKYWDMAKGVTKQESELMFIKACEGCRMKNECPRIWKSYWVIAGNSEFKPIGTVS